MKLEKLYTLKMSEYAKDKFSYDVIQFDKEINCWVYKDKQNNLLAKETIMFYNTYAPFNHIVASILWKEFDNENYFLKENEDGCYGSRYVIDDIKNNNLDNEVTINVFNDEEDALIIEFEKEEAPELYEKLIRIKEKYNI